MIRRPPRSTLDRSSAASDVYKRQGLGGKVDDGVDIVGAHGFGDVVAAANIAVYKVIMLSLIHISEPTRPY